MTYTSKTSKTILYKSLETSSHLTNILGKTNFVLKQSAHFKFFFCLKLVPFVSLTCSHSHLCLLIFPIQQCNLIACFQNCVKIYFVEQLKQVCRQGKAALAHTLVPLKLHGFQTKSQNDFFKKIH